ncbi:protein disulfide-isomerase A2 [Xyrichtys novacula]|uniref:Protein disulfide-isomerase n=1 Tax=Xyrichtys novacula TaxID=13765 RepID=A0AAV1EVC3_XYRNO|nr:protein disulfide-isomerase A2 [Xyrichtys novacula]
MRTRTLLSLTLLGLLLWASYTQADDTDAETDQETEAKQKEETAEEETLTDDSEDKDEEEEQAPQKEKTTEIEEEKDVLVLHINNFARALSEFEYLLVEFYAPWCGHCKQLEPVYAEAAGKLRTELPSVRLAKVDAIEEKELAEEFDIGGFPTLKLFTKGERKETVDFSGKRTVVGIQQWMKRRISPPAAVLDSVDSVAQFIDSQNITVVGFFEDLESEAVKVLKEIAYELTDTEFGLSASPEVFKKYEAKANSVVLFKKFDEGRADFELSEDGTLDKGNLTMFIKAKSLPLVIPFNQEVADKVFTSGITTHCLLFINSSVETHMTLIDESRAVAKKFKGKMLFVSIDVTEPLSHVLNYFGVSDKDVPTVRVVSMVSGKKFAIDSDALTVKSLEELCQGVLDETAKPYYRSEDVPEDWDKGPVKVLVGKNFDSVAMDPTKNVFVEFYAPWCGHCKQLTPIWDQLGEKYADKEDIIIAKMDATANEVESVNVKSFPTLKYFPAGEDKKVIDYTGARDLETMSKFLDNGGVLPPEESDDEDGEDEVEDDDSEEKKEESGDDSKEADEATKEPPKDEL